MEFTTSVKLTSYPFSILHSDKIFTIGSCFSENIGKKFKDYKFDITINPFGQQYNPASISKGLNRILDEDFFTDDDIVYHDELYHSWQHHSDFSNNDKDILLSEINEALINHKGGLLNANYLFITFGTSHVFHWKKDDRIVSNCHKISGSEFNFRFLSSDEIIHQLNHTFDKIKKLNPTLKIILTISPVRYLSFGFFENNLSKANLFIAIEKLLKERNDCSYFPAFEIVMDELRDYRFFAEDMLHPNYQATQYVWDKMCSVLINKETLELMNDIYKINAAVNHKPRNQNSEAHKKFIENTIQKMNFISSKNNKIDWTQEFSKLKK